MLKVLIILVASWILVQSTTLGERTEMGKQCLSVHGSTAQYIAAPNSNAATNIDARHKTPEGSVDYKCQLRIVSRTAFHVVKEADYTNLDFLEVDRV